MKKKICFSRLFVFIGMFIAGMIPAAVYALDCPHPAFTGVSATPTNLIGGDLTIQVTLTFASVIPQTCQHFYVASSSNYQAVNPGGVSNFFGDGTSQLKLHAISKVVDQTETVTISYQARATQSGSPVGNPVSTTVTLTPMALRSVSINPNSINQGQTVSGTITLENIVHNLSGSARVNLSANPASAVTIPSSIQISCCANDGQGHSQGSFNVAARPVNQDTQVTISASRPNQTAITRTVTVRAGLPTLTVSDVTVTEPTGPLGVNATFNFDLSSANPNGASIHFVMSNVTATRCVGKSCDGTGDYVLKGGTLEFGPTVTRKTVQVPICHDTLNENNETFQITLSNPVGLVANDTTVVGTIVDND